MNPMSSNPILNEIMLSGMKSQEAASERIRLQRDRDDLLVALKNLVSELPDPHWAALKLIGTIEGKQYANT